MQRNIYYGEVYARLSLNKKALGIVMSILSFPKIVLDVFLRKNMGERYYSLFVAVLVGLPLFFIPVWVKKMNGYMNGTTTYYIFLVAYAIMSVVRYMEIRREPSVFDFAKFSLSTGLPHPFFKQIKIGGKTPTLRTIEVYYEPLLCFLIAVPLAFLGQPVSLVIIFCSICYFLFNMLAAIQGDHFVMDKIDEIICNQELSQTFIQDLEVSPRQVPFYGKKPTSEQLRNAFAEQVLANDEEEDVAVAM